MPAVEESIRIRAPQDALFDLSQDYALRTAWDPFIREMRFLDGATKAGLGVRVTGRAHNGFRMTVEFVSFNRPGVVAMKMTDGPRLFTKFAGSWRFVPCGGETEVIFRYVFETRPRWLRWLVEPLVAWSFRRDLRARLRGLERGAEEMGCWSGWRHLGRDGDPPYPALACPGANLLPLACLLSSRIIAHLDPTAPPFAPPGRPVSNRSRHRP
jgi:ribosome-associated toxin RatA of RatAB toxin-antitoxin module